MISRKSYIKKYPIKLLISLIVLALFFLSPLFNAGVPISHDGENHMARFASYYQAFRDGNIAPRWAGNLNFGYGTPALIFFYPLPGYLASFVHFVGFSFESSFKLLLGISFVAAFITFYLWARINFNNNTALLGAFLYGLAPYHFLNLYVRGDIGEMLAYVFVPLVFWAIEKIRLTKKLLYVVLGGIFYGLVILSHNGVSLMFSPVFLLYGIIRSVDKFTFVRVGMSFCLGFMISAFFWIPALYEGKYVNAHLFIGHMYQNHFPSLLQLAVSKWGFGPEVGKSGGLSPQIGLLYLSFVVASCILWLKSKNERKTIGVWIVIFLSALFIMLPISTVVWSNLSTLRLYEFPWRFTGLASFAAVVLACYVLEKIKDTKSLFIIGIVLILTSIPLVRVNGYVQRSDSYYTSFTGTTYFHGEASPIWTAGDPANFPKRQIEIVDGDGIVRNVTKRNRLHTFIIDAKGPLTALDNTLYFPGWQVIIDGQYVPIEFQNPNYRGLITFQVPQGVHVVQVQLKESKVRLFADMLSLIAVLLVVIFFARTLLYNKKVKHS